MSRWRDAEVREKSILTGMYLSKFDQRGLKELGFKSFREARNIIGYALGSSPESIKNYRDEFDPLFPNPRKGWHKRPTRKNCLKVFEEYKDLDLASFANLVRSFVGYDVNVSSGLEPELDDAGESAFARRLATGLAAEQYFISVSSDLSEFQGYLRENTTMYGCGYDFRFSRERTDNEFLAVEVKGLMESAGGLTMTRREHEAAEALRDRYYLFVVRNFQRSPTHQMFQDPLSGTLLFRKSERMILQVSWLTSV